VRNAKSMRAHRKDMEIENTENTCTCKMQFVQDMYVLYSHSTTYLRNKTRKGRYVTEFQTIQTSRYVRAAQQCGPFLFL